jgi:hypothetical protein
MDLMYTAIITVVSGFISALVATKLGLQKDLVSTRRERLERYAVSLFAIDELMDSLKDKYLFSNDDIVVNENDLNTVEMLTALYFVYVKDELNKFIEAIRLFKSHVYVSQLGILKAQQQSSDPARKILPTKQVMDDWVNLRGDVIVARNQLLESLIKKYPLLEEKSLIKNALQKIKFYFENPFFN